MDAFIFLMFHPFGIVLWGLGCAFAAVVAMIWIDR